MKVSLLRFSLGLASSAITIIPALAAGDLAPEFTVIGPKGESVKLSDFRGKVVIVDVSATWCGPCQAAMPNNDRIFRKYAGEGVVLLGVTADDSREAYEGWIVRNATRYAFPMTFDPAGRDGWKESVFNVGYHVTGFPTMFVIGRDGKIVETISGGGPGEDYRLEYALHRAGVAVDLASLPPEPKKDPNAPKSIPAMVKTPAIRSGGDGNEAKFGQIAAGRPVPDFKAVGPDGKDVKLSDFRGKTVLLAFFTSNGPSAQLEKDYARYRDQGVVVLGVFSATKKEDYDAWIAKDKRAAAYPVVWDPAGKAWAESISNTIFGIGMYPAEGVVDRNGNAVGGGIGMGPALAMFVHGFLQSAGIRLAEEDLPPPKQLFQTNLGKIAAGTVVPDFTATGPDGKSVRLSDFKGKTVVLDFWATWCGPCQMAMPHLQEVDQKYRAKGVAVLALCCFDTREAYDKWLTANRDKYAFSTAFDPVGKPDPKDTGAYGRTIMMSLSGGISPLPTTAVIDSSGKLVGSFVGYGPYNPDSLGNLLLRAGVTLAKEDMPRIIPAAEMMAHPPGPAEATVETLKAGATAHDFAADDIAGRAVKLSDFKGKVIVLDFWATWCGPCMNSLPHTEKVAAAARAKGVVVLASCTSDARERFTAWVGEHQAAYPDLVFTFDPAGRSPERVSHRLFGVTGIPTQFVIGTDGKIVDVIVGYDDGDTRLEKALAKAGVAVAE